MDIVIGDLQGYHEGVIMRLDYLHDLFAGEGNGLGGQRMWLQKVSATHLG